jgi:hypothetical protein
MQSFVHSSRGYANTIFHLGKGKLGLRVSSPVPLCCHAMKSIPQIRLQSFELQKFPEVEAYRITHIIELEVLNFANYRLDAIIVGRENFPKFR